MSGLAEFHLYANAPSLWLYYALWTLLCVIWNAWLDEDLAWLDAFGEPAVSAIHTCWCCGRGTLPGDIWYNTRTGWYDLPYEPGKFLPLHMIHELSNFRVGKNNNTLSRSYFTL